MIEKTKMMYFLFVLLMREIFQSKCNVHSYSPPPPHLSLLFAFYIFKMRVWAIQITSTEKVEAFNIIIFILDEIIKNNLCS